MALSRYQHDVRAWSVTLGCSCPWGSESHVALRCTCGWETHIQFPDDISSVISLHHPTATWRDHSGYKVGVSKV